MSASLDNVATADAYSSAAELRRPGIVRIDFQVANAAIFYELGVGWPGVRWGGENRLLPGPLSVDRVCSGVRVRSAVAGVPARVTVEAITDHDLPAGARHA